MVSKYARVYKNRYLLVFILALVIRLLLFSQAIEHPKRTLQPDSRMYLSLAQGIFLHGSFAYSENPRNPDAERMPAYPFFIAALFQLFRPDILFVITAQIIIDSLTCVFICRAGEEFVNGSVGLLSGILSAFSLNMITYSHFILNDCLFLFLFMAVILLFFRSLRSAGWPAAACLGIGIGLCTLVRPIAYYFLFCLLGFIFLHCFRFKLGWGVRRAALKAGIVGLLFFLTISPWLTRNHLQFGSFRLSAQAGEHLLQYIVPFSWQHSRGIPFIDGMNRANLHFSEKMKAEQINVDILSPFEKSDLQKKAALEILKQEPVTSIAKAWIFGMAKNLFAPAIVDMSYLLGIERPHFFYTQGTTTTERVFNFISSMKGWFGWVLIGNLALLVLARIIQVWGLIQMMRGKRWEALFFVMIIGYFLLISGPVGYAKYRLPFEPILIVLLAIGLKDLWNRWRLEERIASLTSGLRRKAKSV